MKEFTDLIQMLPYIVPLIILDVTLLAIALIDLIKRKQVTGGNKIIWVLILVFIQIVGPIVYLVVGRKEEEVDSY